MGQAQGHGDEVAGQDDGDAEAGKGISKRIANPGGTQHTTEHAAGTGDKHDRADGAEGGIDKLFQRGLFYATAQAQDHERDEEGNQQGNGGLAQHDKEPYPRGVGVDGAIGRQSIETGVKEDEHHRDEQDGNHRGGRGRLVRLLVLREEGTGDGIGYLDGEFLTGEQSKAVAGDIPGGQG